MDQVKHIIIRCSVEAAQAEDIGRMVGDQAHANGFIMVNFYALGRHSGKHVVLCNGGWWDCTEIAEAIHKTIGLQREPKRVNFAFSVDKFTEGMPFSSLTVREFDEGKEFRTNFTRVLVWPSNESLLGLHEIEAVINLSLLSSANYRERLDELHPKFVYNLAPTEATLVAWRQLASELGIFMEEADVRKEDDRIFFIFGCRPSNAVEMKLEKKSDSNCLDSDDEFF